MNTTIQSFSKPSTAINVILWILQIGFALVFLMAGVVKLLNEPMMVEVFAKAGFGQWLRYVVGVIEVGAALMLLIPKLVPFGALLLICTMVATIIAHLTILGESASLPIILLLLNALILWGRREKLAVLFSRK